MSIADQWKQPYASAARGNHGLENFDVIDRNLQQTSPKLIAETYFHSGHKLAKRKPASDFFSYNMSATHNRHIGQSPRSGHSDQEQQMRFIDSISWKRRFFSHITVEPAAFLAILALYIEFPSIQDLIYTKVCLEVVASHPNLTHSTASQMLNIPLQAQNISQFIPRTIDFNIPKVDNDKLDGSVGSETTSMSPAAGGRIQNSTSNQIVVNLEGFSSYSHSVCDRLNRSAVPVAIRQKITDGDSLFWLKYQIIVCLLCAISCPYWGGISDRIGRLVPMNTSILAAAIGNAISLTFGLLISLNSHSLFNINWLYLGAVLVGLTGGQAVVIVNSFGFISDNTTTETRSKRVTVLESVIFLSHSVGFLASKYIMRLGLESAQRPWLNRHVVAFTVCVILNLTSCLYSILKLRHHKFHRFLNNFEREQQEAVTATSSTTLATATLDSGDDKIKNVNDPTTQPNDRPRELTSSTPDDLDGPIVKLDRGLTNWGAILTLRYYKETYETATRARDARAIILMLLLAGFISALSLATLMSLLYVYLRMDPFNWTTSQYSAWNSYSSISKGLALVTLTICMRFLAEWNVPDAIIASLGFLSKGAGMLMIALATSTSVINWSLVAFIPSEFSMPPIRSLMSKLVTKEELGKLYSCLAAIQSICFLMGNIAFYLAYNTLDRQSFFQISFFVVAGLQFCAVIIMIIIDTTLRSRMMIF